jgi:hypothetical protein
MTAAPHQQLGRERAKVIVQGVGPRLKSGYRFAIPFARESKLYFRLIVTNS